MLPMLATLADAPLRDPHLVYEPKYDGIRALVTVTPGARGAAVAIASRLGNDKTAQFPEIVQALEAWARGRRQAVVLDGEIVALDEAGQPLGFGRLQPRIHLTGGRDVARLAATQPVAVFFFDLLRDGDEDLCTLPLAQRRRRLEATLAQAGQRAGVIRLSRQVAGDGEALMAEAQAAGWEGLIVKDARSLYRPGRRSAEWRKLKLVKRQEFVVGGWTEPRGSRSRFGALLLGLPTPDGRLRYVGHVGGGFSEEALRAVGARLDALAQKACPFETAPPPNDRPHWIRPALVAEVRFGDWTRDGHLRHPVFLGLRDDVAPMAIAREEAAAAQVLVKKSASTAPSKSRSRMRETAAASPSVPVDEDTAAILDKVIVADGKSAGLKGFKDLELFGCVAVVSVVVDVFIRGGREDDLDGGWPALDALGWNRRRGRNIGSARVGMYVNDGGVPFPSLAGPWVSLRMRCRQYVVCGGILRGFLASGISRTRSTWSRPFSSEAFFTCTKSASWKARSKARAAMPR